MATETRYHEQHRLEAPRTDNQQGHESLEEPGADNHEQRRPAKAPDCSDSPKGRALAANSQTPRRWPRTPERLTSTTARSLCPRISEKNRCSLARTQLAAGKAEPGLAEASSPPRAHTDAELGSSTYRGGFSSSHFVLRFALRGVYAAT